MQDIYILDAGCICSLGDSMDDCWDKLGKEIEVETKYSFEVSLPSKLKRSSDRFSKLYMCVLDQMLGRSQEMLQNCPKDRIGTIFSSEYGPIGTNLQFAREVMEKDPDICSPSRFSNTVANACVGIACMNHGFTGVSTMLQGSNCLSFSMDLIAEDKADLIFCGYAEEYNEEIFHALHQVAGMEEKRFTENCEMFLIGNEGYKEKSLCAIKAISEINLRCNAIVLPVANERNEKLVHKCVENCMGEIDGEIDGIIYSSDNDSFGLMETKVLRDRFQDIPMSGRVNGLAGDTLGSSLNMNILLGIMCIKNQQLHPELFGEVQKGCKRLLVTGYDIMGNYTCVVLEAC